MTTKPNLPADLSRLLFDPDYKPTDWQSVGEPSIRVQYHPGPDAWSWWANGRTGREFLAGKVVDSIRAALRTPPPGCSTRCQMARHRTGRCRCTCAGKFHASTPKKD